MVRRIMSGAAAGIMISIGCAVFLACDNKYVGSVMFSVALLTICLRSLILYTGRIGFIPEKHGRDEISDLLLGLLGNVAGVAAGGFAAGVALPKLRETAAVLCEAKLTTQNFGQTLLRGMFCGILMYIAVVVYKENRNVIGILFCIPVFILSGFEHSIADVGYFACAGVASWQSFGFIWTVILGNSLGSMLLPVMFMPGSGLAGKGKNADKNA